MSETYVLSIPTGDAFVRPTALAVSHPGHELRLMKWVEQTRPAVFILTSGSRSGTSRSRVQASRDLARELGATPAELFGRHLDREVYDWILAGDAAPFFALADELAESFVARDIGRVVTDAWQLYNVAHDLWRLTVEVAAGAAGAKLGRAVEVLDYPVVPPSMVTPQPGPERLRLDLSQADVARKLALARAFPEIGDDVTELLTLGGEAMLARETLHDLRPFRDLAPRPGETPLYEQFGEARVASGLYGSVLRWRHVAPIVMALTGVMA